MTLRLEICRTPGQAEPFEHAGPSIVVGRDPSCELPIDDGRGIVSWHHLRLELTTTGAKVRDLGSTNHTRVGSTVVREASDEPIPAPQRGDRTQTEIQRL